MLERLASERSLPQMIVVDNGPEFGGTVLDAWAALRGIQRHFIDPGNQSKILISKASTDAFEMNASTKTGSSISGR